MKSLRNNSPGILAANRRWQVQARIGYRIAGMTLLLSCFLSGSLSTAQELQWLRYRSARKAMRLIGQMDWRIFELSGDKPKDVELPQFQSKSPLFARWSTPMAKRGYLWIALDSTQRYRSYDRLFIDSDGDGQLSDETVVVAYQAELQRSYFGPVRVIFEGQDGPISYHLNFVYYTRNDKKRLGVSSGGWYEGIVTVNGAKRNCVLKDYNANGAFSDKASNPDQSDRIRITDEGKRDTRLVGNFIQVDGGLYQLEVARHGAFIRLAEATNVIFGQIRLPESITQFAAGGENGLITIKPEKGIGRLPVGKYRIHNWMIERQDENGNHWKLEGERFTDKGDFEVADAGETDITTIGEPVVAHLSVGKSNSEYIFKQYLKGRIGEDVTYSCNGSRPRAPKLHIKSANGKYERAYSFEYG